MGAKQHGFHTVETLGPRQSRTAEGYLLCEGVPIGRTGMMLYSPSDLPFLKVAGYNYIKIWRNEEDLFAPTTIASFNGKPVVNEHPANGEDVSPENWKALAVGIIFNVRRGTGDENDLLLADLLITDSEAIADVEAGKREVSSGYEADYDMFGPNEGRQYNIIGNHVALVIKGRCGPRCAIGDSDTTQMEDQELSTMSKTTVTKPGPIASMVSRIRQAFHDKDPNAFEEALQGMTQDEGSAHQVHIHNHMGGGEGGGATADDEENTVAGAIKALAAQMTTQHAALLEAIKGKGGAQDGGEGVLPTAGNSGAALDDDETEEDKKKREEEEAAKAKKAEDEDIEGMIEQEAPAGVATDRARKARDSSMFVDSFQETIATAEILSPGIGLPTFDSSAHPVDTVKQLCVMRRKVLDKVWSNPLLQAPMKALMGGKSWDGGKTMDCKQAKNLFAAMGALQTTINNNAALGGGKVTIPTAAKGSTVQTLADINKANQEFWAGQ